MQLRTNEKAAMQAALEREYKDDTEAAHYLFNLVVSLLSERDAYAVGYQMTNDGIIIGFGPFWGEGEMRRFSAKLPGGESISIQGKLLHSPAAYAAQEKPPDGKYCPDCEHPRFAHGGKRGCVVPKCPCQNFYAYKKK